MKLKREKTTNYYLLDTPVENIYIGEYMVSAPGDYVKVYLLSLMYLDMGKPITLEVLSKQLMLDIYDIKKALEYWNMQGVLIKGPENAENGDFEIEFVNLKDKLYGQKEDKNKKKKKTGRQLADDKIKEMYKSIEQVVGRVLGGTEPIEISSWIDDFGATPEMIVYAYAYCCNTLKKDNVKYVGAVIREWSLKGLTDALKIDEFLAETDRKYVLYKRIFKALGFSRNPTEEEKRIMSSWFDDLEFPIDKILEACGKTSGIANPNINYINKILTEWHKESGKPTSGGGQPGENISVGMVLKYYDYLRGEAESEIQRRREKIYREIPEIKDIEEEIRKASMETSRIMLSGRDDKAQAAAALKQKVDRFMRNKAAILAEHNYSIDYMEAKYSCSICKDTGTTDTGERCSCFLQRLEEAKEWQNSLKK